MEQNNATGIYEGPIYPSAMLCMLSSDETACVQFVSKLHLVGYK